MTISYRSEQPVFYVFQWDDSVPSISQIQANSGGVRSYDYFPDTAVLNDAVCFAVHPQDTRHFCGIKFDVGTPVAATTFTVKWQYGTRYLGTTGVIWKDLEEVNDETNSFQNSGTNYVTWKIPTDWGNYFNPGNGEEGSPVSGSAQWYKHYVRAVITSVSGLTEGGAQSATATVCLDNRITCSNETSLNFAGIKAANDAGVLSLDARTGITATDASAVNLLHQSTKGYKVCQGGALNDLYIDTTNLTGITSFDITVSGLDPAGASQTEVVTITANGTTYLTKYWQVIKTTQVTSVTGTGSFDYEVKQLGWNVVDDGGSETSYVFNCDLAALGTTHLSDTECNVTFLNSNFTYIFAQVTFGEVFRGSYVYKGINFIFENQDSDFSSGYVADDNAGLYNTKFVVKTRSDSNASQGFWGGGLGQRTGQAIADVFTGGWRNMVLSEETVAVLGLTGAITHVEGDGALCEGNTFYGKNISMRPSANISDAWVYENDMSEAAAASTLPPVSTVIGCLNPWNANNTANWWARYVDCNWGLFPDTQKAVWRIHATTNGTPYVYEAYTLKLKATTSAGVAIAGAVLTIKNGSGTTVGTYTSNTDGYFTDTAIDVDINTNDSIYDFSASWASDEFAYRKMLVTSGDAVGYERQIFKDSGGATWFKYAPAIPLTLSAGDRVVILPYVDSKRHEPSAYTPNTYQYSTTTDSNPFTFNITADGYEDFSISRVVSQRIDATIKLSPRTAVNAHDGNTVIKPNESYVVAE